jgi:hypothetical protein
MTIKRRKHYAISTQQLRAAWWYLDALESKSFTAQAALLKAGYAPSVARYPRYLFLRSHGFREAVTVLAGLREIGNLLQEKARGQRFAVLNRYLSR